MSRLSGPIWADVVEVAGGSVCTVDCDVGGHRGRMDSRTWGLQKYRTWLLSRRHADLVSRPKDTVGSSHFSRAAGVEAKEAL